jgi:transposase
MRENILKFWDWLERTYGIEPIECPDFMNLYLDLYRCDLHPEAKPLEDVTEDDGCLFCKRNETSATSPKHEGSPTKRGAPRGRPKISEAKRHEIEQRALEGETVDAIVEKVGVCRNTVLVHPPESTRKSLPKRSGQPRGRKPISKEKQALIESLAREGMPVGQIAHAVGAHRNTVTVYLPRPEEKGSSESTK